MILYQILIICFHFANRDKTVIFYRMPRWVGHKIQVDQNKKFKFSIITSEENLSTTNKFKHRIQYQK